MPTDPKIIKSWLWGRSVARGLSAPVEDHGGLRVDTGLPLERRRYVFAHPGPGLKQLADRIFEPHIYLKVCADEDETRAFLNDRWAFQGPRYVMTLTGSMSASAPLLKGGYRVEVSTVGQVSTAHVMTEDGDIAASGYAAAYGGVFIYDRIETGMAHRRRGLGRVVMRALESTKPEPSKRQVLVATADGRALYLALGWDVHAPYTTATIPAARVAGP